MTIGDLFASLTAAGVSLAVDGDRLVLKGGPAPAHLGPALAEHEATLLALLAPARPSPPEPGLLVDTADTNGARAFMTPDQLRAWLKEHGRDPATVRVRRLGPV
jgi:hypothetical protein